MLKGVIAVAGPEPTTPSTWRDGEALRTCYDHLAGRLSIGLVNALTEAGYVSLTHDGSPHEGSEVTVRGLAILGDFGAQPTGGKRVFCRPCLDWSERRTHIAGRLGAALATRCVDLKWIERQRGSRVLTITPAGADGFARTFGIHLSSQPDVP